MFRRARSRLNAVTAGIEAALHTDAKTTATAKEEAPRPLPDRPLESTSVLRPVISKVVRETLNFSRLERLDESSAIESAHVTDTICISWFYPARYLQGVIRHRYEVEVFGHCLETGEPLGILQLTAGHVVPTTSEGGLLQRLLKVNEPHNSVTLRAVVCDRQQWARTVWTLCIVNESRWWGSLAKAVLGAPYMMRGAVDIRASLNKPGCADAGRYHLTTPFVDIEACEVDNGISLLDPDALTTPCFSDNESALAVLALPRETLMYSHGGNIARQGLRTPVVNPTCGLLTKVTPKPWNALSGAIVGPFPTHDPFAVWLYDDVGECVLLEPELDIENEHSGMKLNRAFRTDEMICHRTGVRTLKFRDKLRNRFFADG